MPGTEDRWQAGFSRNMVPIRESKANMSATSLLKRFSGLAKISEFASVNSRIRVVRIGLSKTRWTGRLLNNLAAS